MIKKIIRAIFSAFISIVSISIIFATWTGYQFISQPTKSNEILYLLQDIYKSQKTLIIDVVDLSNLLLKDTSERNANENNNPLPKDELLKELKGKSQLDESLILEENGNNPLGIVIEQSLTDVREKRLNEISEEPFVDEQTEALTNEIKME